MRTHKCTYIHIYTHETQPLLLVMSALHEEGIQSTKEPHVCKNETYFPATHTHTYRHTRTHTTHTHTHTHDTHTHTHTYAYTHTDTHAHMHAQQSQPPLLITSAL